jgi:hypothetical protein
MVVVLDEGLAARLAQALDICLREAENSGKISR